jgi:hypothetical protein
MRFRLSLERPLIFAISFFAASRPALLWRLRTTSTAATLVATTPAITETAKIHRPWTRPTPEASGKDNTTAMPTMINRSSARSACCGATQTKRTIRNKLFGG